MSVPTRARSVVPFVPRPSAVASSVVTTLPGPEPRATGDPLGPGEQLRARADALRISERLRAHDSSGEWATEGPPKRVGPGGETRDGRIASAAPSEDSTTDRRSVSTSINPSGTTGQPPLERTDVAATSDWSAFGPLAPYVATEGVTDVLVNGAGGLWIDDGHGCVRDPLWSCDERTLRSLAVRLVALGGRHVDEANPLVDVRLGNGIRVHVVLPPISETGTVISIRVPRQDRFSLDDLEAAGMLGGYRRLLSTAITARANLLVTGAAGSGKTTLLSALLAEAGASERIVCIEDVAELRVSHPHVIALESRQANLEGAGSIGLERLVREALRMRPDRLVVGECRGAEVRELMSALNTGHDGGAGTLHANSIDDVPARLEALGALAGLDPPALARQAVSAFDIVVHLQRIEGRRAVERCGIFDIDPSGRLCVKETMA
ncbi:TadA family conjugal transfer-associated ATPase [Planctomonas sp. JC2975]|uniref:TadA family conjugal transfer-associated ATPase n=1 Tax=Planctomonas sp. JC2975 TaxID=2729626 RepID=UPI001475C31E|nr:TadA family conjugal transfer-associated ATPase [Planctomonas sp. JC2975]NNC12971.1 TadA family conjugal transfer-associated ATPase [Planctomonas sp. JC2975]